MKLLYQILILSFSYNEMHAVLAQYCLNYVYAVHSKETHALFTLGE